MNCPLVSVIVPAYNAAPFIKETLTSALHQTYPNIEVIVVDDGSTDLTPCVVEQTAAADSRVKLFHQQNKGVAAARNLAIEKSQGEYIAPLDADDIWYPTKIEKQVAVLEKAGLVAAAAYVWCLSIDERGNLLDAGPKWDLEGDVLRPLVFRNFIGNASVPLFRRSALEDVGGYNEKLKAENAQGCEDWELCLRLAEGYEFRVVQEYLAGYRTYNQSMSFNHEEMGKSYELVMEDIQKKHPEIRPHIYRWSKSVVYLYLTNKSNLCGDLRSSLKWLLKAVHEDAAVLLQPWVVRNLASRLLRLAAYKISKNPRVWNAYFKAPPQLAPKPLSYEEVVSHQPKVPGHVIWDWVQRQRWIYATNKRSASC